MTEKNMQQFADKWRGNTNQMSTAWQLQHQRAFSYWLLIVIAIQLTAFTTNLSFSKVWSLASALSNKQNMQLTWNDVGIQMRSSFSDFIRWAAMDIKTKKNRLQLMMTQVSQATYLSFVAMHVLIELRCTTVFFLFLWSSFHSLFINFSNTSE